MREARPNPSEGFGTFGRVQREEIRWVLIWSVIIVAVASLPYLYAWLSTPPDLRFTGILSNPFDGNSYLAKMRQGARGEWLFHLPFTSEDHAGAFIFTFYLALGHLSALLGWPLIVTYHLARVAAGLLVLITAYWFVARFTPDVRTRRVAFALIGLSSGLGWLAAPSGYVAADLWVPEAITFYSLFANPHFPLAVTLMMLTFGFIAAGPPRPIAAALASLALAVVQPFCVLTVYAVLGGYLALRWLTDRRLPRPETLAALVAGLATAPVMAYDAWVYTTNPVFRGWSAQNVTPSPPPWDYALSYGLVLALAVGGAAVAARRRKRGDLFLLAWVGVNAALLYAPFSLQRRLVTGLHVPLSLLAAGWLCGSLLPRLPARRHTLAVAALLILTLPSNLLVMMAATSGAMQRDPRLYLRGDELTALTWLGENTRWTDTVLAAPQMGLFIPAWAGNRVVYGHPFETIEAGAKKARVEAFFRGGDDALLADYGVAYVFYGPRERALGRLPETGLRGLFSSGQVTIYGVTAGHLAKFASPCYRQRP